MKHVPPPFDPSFLPYPSMRYPVCATKGMVATSAPQAAAAGLLALRQGGNAMDAAVAAASALTVVEPTANGIGGDAFALVWVEKDKKLYGLNASGRAPQSLTLEKARQRAGGDTMPTHGWLPVMTPGVPAAWAALSARFGKLSMKDALAPAIEYAQEGFPVNPVLAQMWARAAGRFFDLLRGPEYQAWFDTFLFSGKAPAFGDIVRLPDHARTLKAIADSQGEDFYRGDLAQRLAQESARFGGFLTKADLASYHPEWVEPITMDYRGYTVCEIPPNGQGIVALMALNILKNFEFSDRENARTFHLFFEAMKLAFQDGKHFVTDPETMQVKAEELLSPEYGKRRAKEISKEAALPGPGQPRGSGTVYLCTADKEGNLVSYIQSNYMGFGSGIVIPGTGIALQNRGHDFSLNPLDANCVAPGKKTYHTIIPGFLMKQGRAIGPFGVMGGYMQPQGHVQVVSNLVDFHQNPQQALDAPRWQWMKDKAFTVESGFSPAIVRALSAMGHEVSLQAEPASFGRGQIIWRQDNGVLVGGCEGRTDSLIACC